MTRLALLDHAGGGYSTELAGALRAGGHDAHVLRPRTVAALDTVLGRRGFATPVSHVPYAVAALARGGFALAHAFSAPDAMAAVAWRRMSGRPAVVTCTEALARDTLANGRLRLWALQRALEGSDALIAGSEESRAALDRWFALSPAVLAAGDAAGYERLYLELLGRSPGSG